MKHLPKTITQEEFEKLFDYVGNMERKAHTKKYKKRLKQYRIAMILGFEAGLRISEIVGYSNDKVIINKLAKENIQESSIRIEGGKGGKDRVVPRPKRLNQSAIDELPLDLERRALEMFIKRTGRIVLNKDITFHTLRHGFASHLINKGVPINQVQILLGHSDIRTTSIYLHVNPNEAIKNARDSF
jgi:integrase/recombinase XerD